jgi:hypothetical protein
MQLPECGIQKLLHRARRQAVLSGFCILQAALLTSVVATGCAKAKAAALPDGPPLSVPAPPPHQIAAAEEVAEAPPPPPPPAPEPAPPAPRPAAARPPARTEPKTDPAPAVAQPTPQAQPAPEGPTVRAAPAAASAGDERKIRDLITKAAGDLKRVDYQKLSVEGKAQYDQSKNFSDEAQAAMKQKNLVYAMTLADKAAMLAAELAGR